MSRRTRIALGIFLASTGWAASAKDPPLTIKVLSAATESIALEAGSSDVPKDCNLTDFSAYCHQSRTVKIRNTMLVEDGGGKSFTISCMVESRWSRCVSLPKGEAFGAQREQRGLAVWYKNSKGKEVKQTYSLVSEAETAAAPGPPPNPAAAISTNPAEAVPSNSPTAKCHFTSTPSGAEIAIDGKYVGNTPSAITVGPGTHSLTIAMPGFAEWKREIAVSAGSDVNVDATLRKAQQ